jgi:hypothetical protein
MDGGSPPCTLYQQKLPMFQRPVSSIPIAILAFLSRTRMRSERFMAVLINAIMRKSLRENWFRQISRQQV